MSKFRVLVADSEPVSRNLLQSSLAYWGCEVMTVETGELACAIIATRPFDLCILKCDLPGMSGIDVCQGLHSTDVKNHPHVLLLAKRSSKKLLSDAYRVGADDLLTTPFQLEELRNRVSVIAQRTSRVRMYHQQPGQVDPIESYRMDLAFISRMPSRL